MRSPWQIHYKILSQYSLSKFVQVIHLLEQRILLKHVDDLIHANEAFHEHTIMNIGHGLTYLFHLVSFWLQHQRFVAPLLY